LGGGIFSVHFLAEINFPPLNFYLFLIAFHFRVEMPPTTQTDITLQSPFCCLCLDFSLQRSYTSAPPIHSLLSPSNLAATPFSPLEASLAKINNDFFVAKFNGHFSVLILPNSSAGFDMVDHSFALESFSSLGFYDNTFS
jgi:hypothetical protein